MAANAYRSPRSGEAVLTVVGTLAYDTMAAVDRLPQPEETAGVRSIRADVFGGTAGNVAMALAKLGARPRVLAGVGPDFAGSAYEAALTHSGVDLSTLVHASEPTSRAYIFYDEHGGQATAFYSGASRALATARVADLSGRVHFAAGEISIYPKLMKQAEWVSFDPGQEVFHRSHAEILACLEHVDLLFLNKLERERLAIPIRQLVGAGTTVVETRGAEGALIHTMGKDTLIAAAPATPKDPTGAGDAHRAGFLYALDKGASMENAARFASILGAFAVESVGPQDGLPSLEQATERYQKAWGQAPAW